MFFNSIYLVQPLFNTCFYSLRSFFVLYAIWRLGIPASDAVSVYSMFMASCYGTTLLGGYLGDHGLGVKGGVVAGGFLSTLGMMCLFFPSENLCLLGLAFFGAGSGLFKPTLMTAVGLTFENPKDFRKTTAYSVIYALGNLGMITIVPSCGFIGQLYGWPYALAMVIVLMAAATTLAWKKLRFHPSYQAPALSLAPLHTMGIIVGLVGVLYALFHHAPVFNAVVYLSIIASVAYIWNILRQCDAEERKGVWAIIGYFLSFAFFVPLFEQFGSSLLLFLNNLVNREVLGINLPPSAITGIQPAFVLLCTLTFVPLVNLYETKVKPIRGSIKLGCGFLFAAAGFLILAFGTTWETAALVPLPWMVLTVFMISLAEMWIAPLSLSKISQAAPERFQSALISFWMMAIAYGHFMGGILAQFSLKPAGTLEEATTHYASFFVLLASIAVGASLVIFVGRRVAPALIARLTKSATPGA